MKIGVTGASGFIGQSLVAEILANNNEAIGFSRSPDRSIDGCSEVRDFSSEADLDLNGLDAMVHLAGESIMGLWTKDKKQEILNSRIRTTQRIVNSLWSMDPDKRPKVFACASAVGIYGDRGDEVLDEESDGGFGFLADVVKQWEEVASKAEEIGVRTIFLRIGFVLGHDGGALPLMKNLFRLGLGGRLGSGQQYMPWVHVEDVAGIFHASIDNEVIRGPVNVCAPKPVTNREFTKTLASAVGKKPILPVPEFAIKALPGGMEEIFLNSHRVEPTVMLSHGYKWQFSDLNQAIQESI